MRIDFGAGTGILCHLAALQYLPVTAAGSGRGVAAADPPALLCAVLSAAGGHLPQQLGVENGGTLWGQALAAHRRWRAGGQIGSRFGDLWRDLVRQIGQLAFLLFAFWWAARCAGLTAAVDRGGRVWVALMGVLTGGVWLALLLYGRGVTAAYEKQAVWLVQDMVTGVLLYGVLCARFSLRRGNWATGFQGLCIFAMRFGAVLLVAVLLCVAKVMVLPQGAVQSVYMVDSSVTRVERMAGYGDLLTLFRESNGVEDLF